VIILTPLKLLNPVVLDLKQFDRGY